MRLPLIEQPKRRGAQGGRNGGTASPDIDIAAVEREMKREVEGEARFDAASRGAYSTDASNYRRVPAGVVVPRTDADVAAAVEICRKHGLPIVSRGGGTSLNGQCVTRGIVMDFSKHMNEILDIDPERKIARVQPGVVLDSLNARTIREHGLAFGPDPSTHSHCTFGGMIGNNSCGVHSILAGRVSDNVREMRILTSDGVRLTVGPTSEDEFSEQAKGDGREGGIYADLLKLRNICAESIRARYPDIPRRVSGYNLPDLLPERDGNVAAALVGSEGTCVTILDATVRLVAWPAERVLLVLGYPSIYEAGDHVPEIMEAGPMGLEGLDDRLVEFMRLKRLHPEDVELMPDGRGWLLVEFGGDTIEEASEQAKRLMDRLGDADEAPHMELIENSVREERIWAVRESGLGATAFVPGKKDAWPGWEDVAIPPDKVGPYLRGFRSLLNEFEYDCALYGHFGQGCIHCRINFDLVTADGLDRYRDFVHQAADLCVKHGGSLSAEHGDALAKSELLPKMFGDDLVEAFGEFKRIWDPAGIMNPGKIVDAPSVTTDLRLGADFAPERLHTEFAYGEAGKETFERAAIRCVGVGECRRRENAFMCPSYLATQEEIHTTRGRARLLFEMARGDFIRDRWRSDAVRESLDLCLSCKACKQECPVNVDMATYKAEFLHHYYKRRLRPREFYSMGDIGLAARVASIAPGVANWFGSAAGVSRLTKWMAGIAPDRDLPSFSSETFRHWFARRNRRTDRARGPGSKITRGRVLLIPDVFNDHFFPQSLRAATHVLETLGYAVELPPFRYPAIRPIIHYGFLNRARRQLRSLIDRLDPFAAEGAPILGLEPSTVAVLRDEAEGMFPGDPAVQRISHCARLLSEFLAERHLDDLPAPGGPCLFHAHCHQKAVLDADGARKVLKRMGYEAHEPERGCCGMAGSFGFERKHAALSRDIGEMNLLPTVRELEDSAPVVIEGFSCREQIAQDTPRRPVHIAELVADAMS